MTVDLKKNRSLRVGLLLVIVVFFYFGLVTLLIYVEKDSSQSAITNYSNGIWYTMVTLTTVGYGDLFPATLYGRIIGYVFILTSMGIFGLLIGEVNTLMATIKESKKLGHGGTNFSKHAIIIGWNDFAQRVVDQLVGVEKQVAIVTNHKEDIEKIREEYPIKKVFILYSSTFKNIELLKKANIEKATIIFINLKDDTEKLIYVLSLKKQYPDIEFAVSLDNSDLKQTFIDSGVSNIISTQDISSKLLASYMFEPDVAFYSESILSYAHSDSDYDIKQLIVTEQNPYNGKSYQDVFFDLKRRYNTVLIGITKIDKSGQKKLIKNPLGDLKISTGDYLIMILNGKAFKLIQKVFDVEEGLIKSE